ncbi:hypothetical protein AB7M70_009301 [Bradyrhizobium japonicum]
MSIAPLMMRAHHCDEVAIDVAGRLGRHVVHHLGHRRFVFFQKRTLLRAHRGRRGGRMGFMREHERRECKREQNWRGKERRAEAGPEPSASACEHRYGAAEL